MTAYEVKQADGSSMRWEVLGAAAPVREPRAERPTHHHYAVVVMRIALHWICLANVSLRAAAKCFTGLPGAWALGTPSSWTIRFWILRLGLYELQRPKPQAADWVFIVDSTLAIGQHKALVILGVRLGQMERRGFNLGHQDVVTLGLHLLTQCNGLAVQEALAAAAQVVGVPRLVVSDAGGDVKKGVTLFQAEHPAVTWNYDLTHRLALLLEKTLGGQAWWTDYLAQVGRCRQACQQTEWSHLQPPAQRTKARWLNVRPLVSWGLQVIAYGRQARLRGGSFAAQFGWLEAYEWLLEEALQMVTLCQEVCRLIKQEGLNTQQVKTCGRTIRKLGRTPRAKALGRQVVSFLRRQAAPAKAGETLLGSSDVIESLFGKYKAVVERSPLRAITVMVLLVAALTSTRTEAVIQAAMETVSTADVLRWSEAQGAPTLLAKRRAALSPPKGTKLA